MTQTRVIRPDLRAQDRFVIELDESMLMWLEDGALAKIVTVRQSIYNHDECDLFSEKGCNVRNQWLIDNYGSIEEAQLAGRHQTDCGEDLTFLHHELGRLMGFLTQSRWIRNHPDGRSMLDHRDAVAKLTEIKGEVAHREERAKESTGLMQKLDDEYLAELDAAKAAAAKDDEQDNDAWPAVPAKSNNGKLLDLKVPEVPKPVSGGAKVKTNTGLRPIKDNPQA